jgi:hypothetical protein
MKESHNINWLDDKIMELHRLDEAIKLGRLQGEVHMLATRNGETHRYERTTEYRLQKHYEKKFARLIKVFK